jgi:REP element-mobilizing transposase RayT
MARKLRIQYAGAVYHVMNHGDRQEEIFRDDLDRRRFLESGHDLALAPGSHEPGTARSSRREEALTSRTRNRMSLLTSAATRFTGRLAQACGKTGRPVHAYCLMPNHFHLVVETPQPNLVAGMKWFLGTYTSGFNRRHKLFGHLFSGRYKALVVDSTTPGYLKTVCDGEGAAGDATASESQLGGGEPSARAVLGSSQASSGGIDVQLVLVC